MSTLVLRWRMLVIDRMRIVLAFSRTMLQL